MLQGALSWAGAESPNVLLFIVSNFLSNPAKEFLQRYTENRRPPFRIVYWEKPQLEVMTLSRSRLLQKYKLAPEMPFLSLIHPAHALYLKGGHDNSLSFLFRLLDRLDRQKLEESLGVTFMKFIQPRFRQPVPGDERMIDLRLDQVDYASFKRACERTASSGVIPEDMLVLAIVSDALAFLFQRGDTTSTDEFRYNYTSSIANFHETLATSQDEKEKEAMRKLIEEMSGHLQTVEEDIRRNYDLYTYFCRNVVGPLMLENLAKSSGPAFDEWLKAIE